MKKSKKLKFLRFILWLTFGVSLLIPINNNFEIDINSDLSSVLSAQNVETEAARVLFENKRSRQLIITITSNDFENGKVIVDEVYKKLKSFDILDQLDFEINEESLKAHIKLINKHKYQLLDPQFLNDYKKEGWEFVKKYVLEKIYSPFNTTFSVSDPLYSQMNYFLRQSGFTKIKSINGYLGIKDGNVNHFIIHGSFKSRVKVTSINLKNCLSYLENLRNDKKEVVSINFVSPIFYYLKGFESGQSEAKIIGVGSILGIIVLILLFYGSIKIFLISILIISSSFILGFSFTHFIFDGIHLFTLVLASSVIGLIIDYIFHLISQSYNSKINSGAEAIKFISKPLLISFVSTAIGFSILAFTNFLPLKQLAVFVIFGLAWAILFLFSYPESLFSNNKNKLKYFDFKMFKISKYKYYILSVLILFISYCLLFLPSIDNVKELQKVDSELSNMESYIRDILKLKFGSEYVLISGSSEEEVLFLDEQIHSELHNLGLNSIGISKVVPSEYIQNESLKIYSELMPQIKILLHELGLSKDAKMNTDLSYLENLSIDQLENSGILKLNWLGQINNRYYSVINIFDNTGSIDLDRVSEKISGKGSFIDPISDANKFFYHLQSKSRLGLILISIIVFILLKLVFPLSRSFKISFFSTISSLFGMSCSALVVGHLNAFHWLGGLLVYFLGIDYFVFCTSENFKIENSTRIALFCSCLTTILSFGLLGLSSTIAISSFGFSVLFGILICFLFTIIFYSKNEILNV